MNFHVTVLLTYSERRVSGGGCEKATPDVNSPRRPS